MKGWSGLSGFAFKSIMLAAREIPDGTILSFDNQFLVSTGIQLFNVAFITVILIFLLYKPVRKYMTERAERIKNEIDAAKREYQEAIELKEKYEGLLEGIEKEREDVLHQAHKMAMEKSDQMLFNARKEADMMYDRALAELETERKNVMDEMKRQMIEISILMAGRFVEVSIDRDTQDKFIDEALSEWEES